MHMLNELLHGICKHFAIFFQRDHKLLPSPTVLANSTEHFQILFGTYCNPFLLAPKIQKNTFEGANRLKTLLSWSLLLTYFNCAEISFKLRCHTCIIQKNLFGAKFGPILAPIWPDLAKFGLILAQYGQILWPKDWYLIIFTNTFELYLKFPSKWGITLILLRNDYLGPNLALFWPQYGQISWPKDWYLSSTNEYLPKESFLASLMVK